MSFQACKICNAEMSEPVQPLFALPSVTSDCRPWRKGRSVKVCSNCGVMERVLLDGVSFDDIYDKYKMFGHSSGGDQINFSGIPEGRTQKILKFADTFLLYKPKSILDIGSGSGAGLVALAKQYPQAMIYGYEPHDNPERASLPENVWVLNRRPEKKNDLVTLFHVFEHVQDLHELLNYIRSVLTENGTLLIQVPYAVCGAFDLVIADHIWHFTKKSIVEILRKNGFATSYVGNDLIEKELTVLAYPTDSECHYMTEEKTAADAIDWILRYKNFLDRIRCKSMAIYGTGPAGAWAGHILGDRAFAYLDDDQSRIGSTFNGKPVTSPEGWPLPVIAPFPDIRPIRKKNKRLNIIPFI